MSSSVLRFHTYNVTRQAFYKSSSTFAIVNNRPLIPGHVLICPMRPVPRLADLSSSEITDLFLSVQKVGKVIERVYEGQGLTVSCQDGSAAGQSVPHVHIHILPRRTTDFDGRNDDVYPALEKNEHQLDDAFAAVENGDKKEREVMTIPKDEDRKVRTEEDMEKEAQWLASFFKDDEN